MKKDSVILKELQNGHTIDDCDGIMVPQFHFLTSSGCLRIVGYCVKCGRDLEVNYPLAELEKMCPSVSDSDTCAAVEEVLSKQQSLEDFQPPSGTKPN